MPVPLHVLFVEDRPSDVDLLLFELRRSGYEVTWQRVDEEPDYREQLRPDLDVILTDYNLPQFDATTALQILHETGLDIPFIVVSASIPEEFAVEMMKQGAADYLLKDRLGRLGAAIDSALQKHQVREARRKAEEALRESEARHRAISELSSDYAYSLYISPDGSVVSEWITDAFMRITGFTLDEVSARGGWMSLVHPADRERLESRWQDLLAGCSTTAELRVATRSGGFRTIRDRARPVYDPATGRVHRIYGAAEDITQQRLLEEQLRHSQKMEAIGRLAGGVAHDFNNTLSVIRGYTEFALEDLPPDTPLREDLEEIRKAADRASSLTRQLLAFSRKQVLAPHDVSIRELIQGVERMTRRVIGEDIELETRFSPGLDTVFIDSGQMEQVLLNLVVNARDAMPGGGRLTISTGSVEPDELFIARHPEARPEPYVVVEVSDTGCGMTREVLQRVFEPFFTTKEAGKGTGLGLATVYGTIQQSGGFITVYSEPNLGTTFKLYLPCITSRPPETGSATGTSGAGHASETVLLVEDEAEVRKLTFRLLSRYGYRILEAASAEEALALARHHRNPIHLLLTDLVLPGMPSRELIEELRRMHPEARLLLTSGYPDEVLVGRGLIQPGEMLLQKPFTAQDLARKVRGALDRIPDPLR